MGDQAMSKKKAGDGSLSQPLPPPRDSSRLQHSSRSLRLARDGHSALLSAAPPLVRSSPLVDWGRRNLPSGMALARLRGTIFTALVCCCLAGGAVSEPEADKAALLAFLEQTPHANEILWNSSTSACEWRGVTCDSNRSRVVALRLPGSDLVGPIPASTLSRLDALRVLSLRSNRLSGALPPDFVNLRLLRSLYLQDNRLSGQLPAAVGRLTGLVRMDLSGNNLSGPIPSALGNLTRLTGLFLQSNNFSGSIPAIDIPGLVAFNVSYNRLNGSVPRPLQGFPSSSFVGNLALCGGPLPPCTASSPSPPPSPVADQNPAPAPEKRKLSAASIIAIAVACGAALLLILLLLLFCLVRRRRRREQSSSKSQKAAAAAVPRSVGGPADTATTTSSSKDEAGDGGAGGEKNKLVFVGEGNYGFDLEDLLRASAEVLGKGTTGTSYKAVLEDGVVVVVKRLKDVALSKRDFESQMELLGRLSDRHLVALRAFYYSKDEKLLVYDFFPAGSLSALLHGGRGSGRTPLDWESRLRIAVAAGKGLAHLHAEAKVVHGNVKASNVLLGVDPDDAAVSDYGLAALFGGAWPSRRVAGYRAPELVETRRASFKSDVYSFGVLLLELLTGKAPNLAAAGEEGVDLPRWVQSVVREEWTAEVFDAELIRYAGMEEEMVRVLQVAMACVQPVPDTRPEMAEVLRTLEQVLNRTPPDVEPPKSGGSGEPTP